MGSNPYVRYERRRVSQEALLYLGVGPDEVTLTPKQAAGLVKDLLGYLQAYHNDRRSDEPELLVGIAADFTVRVQVAEIRPGDTLVFSHPTVLPDVAWARITSQVEKLFPNVRAICLEENARLFVLRPSEMGEAE